MTMNHPCDISRYNGIVIPGVSDMTVGELVEMIKAKVCHGLDADGKPREWCEHCNPRKHTGPYWVKGTQQVYTHTAFRRKQVSISLHRGAEHKNDVGYIISKTKINVDKIPWVNDAIQLNFNTKVCFPKKHNSDFELKAIKTTAAIHRNDTMVGMLARLKLQDNIIDQVNKQMEDAVAQYQKLSDDCLASAKDMLGDF